MIVIIKTLVGRNIEIIISKDHTIRDLKEILFEKEGIPVPQQRLIYNGRLTADDKSLEDYNVESGSTFHCVLALR